PRLAGGDQRELLAAVHPAGLYPAHDLHRVDSCRRGDPHRQLLGPGFGQGSHTAPPGQHRRPGRRGVPAERGRRAEPGDDDGLAIHRHAESPAFLDTKFTTSWTVVRSLSWSSGISTPNLSWAATAISTMDSESMSRSSTKLLLGVTSSAGTPAISSTISPIPARISCSFMPVAPCLKCSYWSAAPRRGGGSSH